MDRFEVTALPQLITLLKFCRLAGITPVQIFSSEASSIKFRTPDATAVGVRVPRRRKRYRKFDRQTVKATLLHQLAAQQTPPPSLAEVARNLGDDPSFLERKLPDECAQISERYAEYQHTECIFTHLSAKLWLISHWRSSGCSGHPRPASNSDSSADWRRSRLVG